MRGVSCSSRVSIEINDLLIICELATSKFGCPPLFPEHSLPLDQALGMRVTAQLDRHGHRSASSRQYQHA